MPPSEVRRRSGSVGQARGHQAAGARLGDGDGATVQQRCDLLVDRRAVAREQRVSMAGGDELDERVIGLLGGRLVDRRDLDLAAAQAGRDLELVELQPAVCGRAQRVRDLGLRNPEQADDPAPVGRARPRSPPGTPRSDGPSPTSAEARAAVREARRRSGPSLPPAARRGPARCRPGRAPSPLPGSPPACGSTPGSRRRRDRASVASSAAGSPRSAPRAADRAPSRGR